MGPWIFLSATFVMSAAHALSNGEGLALTISPQSARINEAVRTGRRSCPHTSGPVAQLGARFHGMEEVVGSIPTRSTKSRNS